MLHSICHQIWKTQQWSVTGLENVSFHSNPKERQCPKMFILMYNCAHFTSSRVMLTILQARLQQYTNQEIPHIQVRFRKGRGTRDQIVNIYCQYLSLKMQDSFRKKKIYFCFIDYAKAFDCVDHNRLGKILKERGIQDYPTCLLRNLYAHQEITVRPGHGTTDWFQIGKGVCQGSILSPC